jgi:hypothetical protein
MEPQFQTSFIPKKPVDSGVKIIGAKSPTSIVSIVVWAILTLTIIASVALFAYQKLLQSEVSQAQVNISAAKEAFQPDTIAQLVNVSNQISFTEKLLQSHVLTSRVLDTLETLTLKKITLTDFSYSADSGTPTISGTGESQSYNALAQQPKRFSFEFDIFRSYSGSGRQYFL